MGSSSRAGRGAKALGAGLGLCSAAAFLFGCAADVSGDPAVARTRTSDEADGVVIRGQAVRLPSTVSMGESTFETSVGSYALGDQTDAQGRGYRYVVAWTSDVATITPSETGWFMTPARPQTVAVSLAGYVDAELTETFVKRSDAATWDPVDDYQSYGVTAGVSEGCLLVDVGSYVTIYPGMPVNTVYASDGRPITVATLIGPQTLLTDASVAFAYLIKMKSWSGE